MDFTGINFMGAAVGILALICALVLLFGRSGTRKILGWGIATVVVGWGVIALLGWSAAQRQASLDQAAEQAEQAKQEQAEQAMHGPGRVACDGQWSDLLRRDSTTSPSGYQDFIRNCIEVVSNALPRSLNARAVATARGGQWTAVQGWRNPASC
jgi:hypothetical protein